MKKRSIGSSEGGMNGFLKGIGIHAIFICRQMVKEERK